MLRQLTAISVLLAALCGVVCATLAPAAQPAPPDAVPPLETREPPAPRWSSQSVASVGDLLEGSWRSAEPIAVLDDPATEQDESEQAVHVVMHVARVRGIDAPNLMYVELARADTLNHPYHQSLLQLVEFPDHVRLRSIEIASRGSGLTTYAGLWAAPDVFPRFEPERLIPRMDIPLEPTEEGFRGRTPHRYPTLVGQAVETLSEIEIHPDYLVMHDRGLSGTGETVWGERIRFEPYDPPVEVRRHEGDLVIVEYPPTGDARAAEEGDMLEWAYEIWLYDNARMVASSDFHGQSLRVRHPMEQFIRAMQVAADEPREGTIYRIYAPAEFAFGEQGNARRLVPPNATVIVHTKLLSIDSSEPAESGSPDSAPGPRSGDGSGQGGVGQSQSQPQPSGGG